MSLRHALLAILTAEPMTGYDLVKYFDGTVAFVWSAPHSQIYPELRRMDEAGLITSREILRGERATKRLYNITDSGTQELRRWTGQLVAHQPERDVFRLKAAFFEWGTYESARRQLQEHLNHYSERLNKWEQSVADIEARHVPLLRHRLEKRPPEEHEAIIAFKSLAFRGEISRTRSEIEWAREGLELIDQLERRGVPLDGWLP